MENKYKNIFSPSDPLTRGEIEDYLQGKLSPEDRNRVEIKIENNELNRAAMEGYALNPEALKNFPQLKTGFLNSTFSKALIFSSLMVIIAIIAFFILNKDKSIEKPVNKKPIEFSQNDKQLLKLQISDEIEINNSIEIEETEQITYKKTIENQVIPKENLSYIEKAETLKAETLHIEKNAISLEIEMQNRVNSEIIYIHDLKTVDYSGIYSSGIKVFLHNLAGLDAKYSNYEEKQNSQPEEYTIEFIPYKDFLEKALEKFVENNYKAALKDFRIILSQYNDDLNSTFYSGLCYYNIGKWKKAVRCFNLATNHRINVFHQEALWYKAISLSKDGQYDEAIILFMEIVNNKGFYSKRAAEILKKDK